MEYVSGGSLREQLQQLDSQGHVLQTEDAINITRQIAGALAVAHRAGIIHRDIKPSNILLRADGTPVLTDLGIAKIQTEATLTRVDEIIGTPYYMSPEQVSSKPVDGRSGQPCAAAAASAVSASCAMLAASTWKYARSAARVSLRPKPSVPSVWKERPAGMNARTLSGTART